MRTLEQPKPQGRIGTGLSAIKKRIQKNSVAVAAFRNKVG